MATYEFFCGDCMVTVTREEPMKADHTPPPCPNCMTRMGRVFNSNSICDEVRGVKYFDPNKKAEVKGHGRVFDLGLGKFYESKSQRRALIKEKGLKEYGGREV